MFYIVFLCGYEKTKIIFTNYINQYCLLCIIGLNFDPGHLVRISPFCR
jgi:hypothetical protein